MNQKFYIEDKNYKKFKRFCLKEGIQIGSFAIYEYLSSHDNDPKPILPELGLFNPFFDFEVKDPDLI
jgi:CRISPR/Cas system-associated protein endoribonuclease Cas2